MLLLAFPQRIIAPSTHNVAVPRPHVAADELYSRAPALDCWLHRSLGVSPAIKPDLLYRASGYNLTVLPPLALGNERTPGEHEDEHKLETSYFIHTCRVYDSDEPRDLPFLYPGVPLVSFGGDAAPGLSLYESGLCVCVFLCDVRSSVSRA